MFTPYPSGTSSMPSESIDPSGPNTGTNPPSEQNIEEISNENGAPSPSVSKGFTDKINQVGIVLDRVVSKLIISTDDDRTRIRAERRISLMRLETRELNKRSRSSEKRMRKSSWFPFFSRFGRILTIDRQSDHRNYRLVLGSKDD